MYVTHINFRYSFIRILSLKLPALSHQSVPTYFMIKKNSKQIQQKIHGIVQESSKFFDQTTTSRNQLLHFFSNSFLRITILLFSIFHIFLSILGAAMEFKNFVKDQPDGTPYAHMNFDLQFQWDSKDDANDQDNGFICKRPV